MVETPWLLGINRVRVPLAVCWARAAVRRVGSVTMGPMAPDPPIPSPVHRASKPQNDFTHAFIP